MREKNADGQWLVMLLSHAFEEGNCNCAVDGKIQLLGKSYDFGHEIDLLNTMCMQGEICLTCMHNCREHQDASVSKPQCKV